MRRIALALATLFLVTAPSRAADATAPIDHYLDAIDALELGDDKQALAAVDRAIAAAPNDAWYPYLRGVIHFVAVRTREAAADFDAAERLFRAGKLDVPANVDNWRRAVSVMAG